MRLSLRTRAILWACTGVAATGLAYFYADRDWSTFAHATWHKPGWAVLLTKLGEVPAPLALLGLVAVIAASWGGRLTPVWRRLLGACLATLLATLLVIMCKHLCGRPWPETWTHNNPSWIKDHVFGFAPLHGGDGFASFPSGHTARLAAPLTVGWHTLPRWRLVWALPLVLVVVGLLVSDFHFVSDCIAGAYLGVACGLVGIWVSGAKRG